MAFYLSVGITINAFKSFLMYKLPSHLSNCKEMSPIARNFSFGMAVILPGFWRQLTSFPSNYFNCVFPKLLDESN